MLKSRPFKQAKPERKALPFPAPISGGIAAPCGDVVAARPKTEPKRNPHLLAMARGQSCTLRILEVCNRDTSTTVAAHSNLSIHGKAKGRKADDQFHVHACSACHAWLDFGPAPTKDKNEAFITAHYWMVLIWHDIANGPMRSSPKDRAAAQWALDQLSAAGK
jgi:putative nuclease YbcO-like protein